MKNDREVKLTLRLPPSLHKKLQRIAEEQQRSLNSQMVYILLDWVSKQRRRTISEPVYDEAYFEAMQAMDDEDIEISGQVTITPEAAEAISRQIE